MTKRKSFLMVFLVLLMSFCAFMCINSFTGTKKVSADSEPIVITNPTIKPHAFFDLTKFGDTYDTIFAIQPTLSSGAVVDYKGQFFKGVIYDVNGVAHNTVLRFGHPANERIAIYTKSAEFPLSTNSNFDDRTRIIIKSDTVFSSEDGTVKFKFDNDYIYGQPTETANAGIIKPFTALTASATEMNRFFYGEETDFTSNGYSGMYIAGYDSVVRLKYTSLSTASARPQNAIGVVYDSDNNEVDAKLTIMDGSLLRINFNSNGEFPYTLKVKAGSKFLSPLGYYRFNFTEDFFISVGKAHETANNFNKYAVNFLKDGNLISTVAVAPNETISIPDSNPSKESTMSTVYTFAYWYTNDVNVEYNFATPVTSSMKINAKFNESPRQYDVKFGDEAPVKYGYGSKVTKPANPTKESTISTVYTFAYWYTDDETVAFDFENETVAGDIAFTAKFNESPRQYDVKFGDEASVKYGYGSKVTKPADPTKETTISTVYTFAYWYIDDETVAFDFENETVAGDITFTAKFNEAVRKYTITFVDEDTTELQSSEVEYGTLPVYNGEQPTKESTSEYYYLFNGWDNEIVIVSGDATYTATYSEHLIENEYTVTFDSNGGSSVSTQTVQKNNKVTKPSNPTKESTVSTDYTFAYWYIDDESVAFDFNTSVIKDLVLKAKFNESARKYNVVITFEGIDGLSNVTKEVEYGGKVNFNEFNKEGYTFKVLKGEDEISELTVNGETTLKVVYTAVKTGCSSNVTSTTLTVSTIAFLFVLFVIVKRKKEN